MRIGRSVIVGAFMALAACAFAQQAEMKPFVMDWQDNSGSSADVGFLLDAPAGRTGFIGVRDGHLVYPDGRRFRIWGINIVGGASFPPQEQAASVAAHLARFGLNCVRMHFLDSRSPGGLVDDTRADTRALDPKQFERLDFFIAELKKRGIYVDLNLNVGRIYKAGDGVHDAEYLGFAKALTYFDERLLELQREYARQLLTHFNPYTKSEYRHEPAVLCIEFMNENSLVEAWVNNRLQGKATRKNPAIWTDIPESYERALTEKYRQWLEAQSLPVVPRLSPAEFTGASPERFRREAAFYMEIEERFHASMQRYLKDELGEKSLLLGTSDHNHHFSGYPLLHSVSRLDIVDGHVYWQQPRSLVEPGTGGRIGFELDNTPMVNDPLHSSVVQLSRSAFQGKPYTVSEVNHPFPNEYASEGIPILAAYGAFQDWDGIFWYAFAESRHPAEMNSFVIDWQNNAGSPAVSFLLSGHYEFRTDPVKMSELAAGAVLFQRADVRTAAETVTRSYSLAQVYESLRLPRAEGPYFTPGFPLALPLVHGSRIAGLDGPPTGTFPAFPPGPLISDTKELAWREGLVMVDSDRSQALIGSVSGHTCRNLAVKVQNRFCTIMLTSLDGAPLRRAKQMLLTTGGRVANTGMKWNEKRTSLTDWGTAPTVIEPVTGTITLRGLVGAESLEAAALDGAGRPIAKVKTRKTPAGWDITVGDPATPWYVITVGPMT
ncbi:MAG: hypothetical protein ABSH56_13265 [Bryobacteraceae bacterium]